MAEMYSFFSDPKIATRLSEDKQRVNLTQAELLSVARAAAGEEGAQHLAALMDKTVVSSDRFHLDLGFCSLDSKDVHIHPISDRYSVVYWGGDSAETSRLWNFQISRSRPSIDQGRPLDFDPDCDYPVNLREEHIAVLAPVEGRRVQLRGGAFIALEGGVIHVDITSIHGTATIPVTFPTRSHHKMPPGHVELPL